MRRRKPRTSAGDVPCPIDPSMSAPIPKSKPPRLRKIIQSALSPLRSPQPFIKGNTTVVAVLEAVNSAADVFPPLKSVSGGALWIAKTLRNYKSSNKDEKAFADYLQNKVARVVASVVTSKDGEYVTSLKPHVQELNRTLNDIREEINHWQSQPPRKRFGRIIRNAQPIQEYRMRLDRALVIFNLGTTVVAHEELSKILREIDSIASALRSVTEAVEQTTIIGQDVRHRLDEHEAAFRRDVTAIHRKLDGIEAHPKARVIPVTLGHLAVMFSVFLG